MNKKTLWREVSADFERYAKWMLEDGSACFDDLISWFALEAQDWYKVDFALLGEVIAEHNADLLRLYNKHHK